LRGGRERSDAEDDGAGGWYMRTVESSGSKLKERLGNFSATAIWQATSYIKSLMLLFGVVTIDGLLLFPSDGWEPHLH
jgi:hypothetical protein